uniref:Uncharacterized protein n=1 Tax=Acrobeloides nanus TaxID=290746 RepID=A0A914E2U9_9BILA
MVSITLLLYEKERHNQVEILTKEKNEALGELSRVTTCFKEINTASEALLTSKDKQLEEAIKLNAELQKEIEILNETMAALPSRLEADIGIEDTRVIELEAENLGFKQKFGAQEKKFQEEIQKWNSILENENIEKKELTAKLAEAKANILSLANVVKKQEGEIDELKKLLEVKEKEYEESIQKIQENQTKMTQQINSLKSKWRSEAKRNFHESMSYVQKNYKQMLAVEELGFLKSSDDFTPMNMSISMSMNHAPSAMSVMTSSSSYEKIDEGSTQDLTGSQFWSVPEESEEIKQSE